jgi:PKD repeat protein
LWEFGDGTVSTQRNPSHVYYETGSYTVSLTVTSAISPASKKTLMNYVVVRDATTMKSIGVGGGSIETDDATLAIPQGALSEDIIFGVADDDGAITADTAGGDSIVSDICSIAHDHSDFFVSTNTLISLEIPFVTGMVPAEDRNGAKLQIMATLSTGVTIPIMGEVVGNTFVAPIAGLPHRASYAVVYRPDVVTENIPADDDDLSKAAKTVNYTWNTNSWRVNYTPSQLQALTALRIGSLDYQYPYDQRSFDTTQTALTLSDLRNAVRQVHNISKYAGFASPALIPSTDNEFTLILHDMNETPVTDYDGVAEVAYTTSIFGSIVVDPAQLIAITKLNPIARSGETAGIEVDRMQELDFTNAFTFELVHSMFRAYGYPIYTADSTVDLDESENPTDIPYYKGVEDGLATFMGQLASVYHSSISGDSEYALMARSLGLNEYSTFWEPLFSPLSRTMPGYSFASQDFFFFLGLRHSDLISGTSLPKLLLFIADSYEGVLEMMRIREGLPTVTNYDTALKQTYVAVDLALQKTFKTTLADFYWDYAQSRAYENGKANAIRPTDLARKELTFSSDRFDDNTMVKYTFTKLNTPITLSYDTNPDALMDIPPLSTRAILLSASGVAGDLTLALNTYDWVEDSAGNSMKVKVYKEGALGSDMDAENAQLTLSGMGETDGFTRAIILISNVSMEKSYPVSLTASVVTATTSDTTGIIGGQLTDASSGDAIQGATVVANKISGNTVGSQIGSTTTDSRGLFVFTSVPVGSVQLTFTASGYETQKTTVTVTAGETTIVRQTLSSTK